MTPDQAREENAYTLGVQAYLWGYPLRFYGELISGPLKAGGTYLNDQVKSRTRVGALGVRVFVNGTTDLPKAREPRTASLRCLCRLICATASERFYGPETSILDGSYRLPAVHRVP